MRYDMILSLKNSIMTMITFIFSQAFGCIAVCNSLTDCPIGKYGVDFNDGNSLLSHLNSPLVTKLYDRITSYPSTKCVDCEKFDMCGGGCMMFWTSFKPQDCIPGWK